MPDFNLPYYSNGPNKATMLEPDPAGWIVTKAFDILEGTPSSSPTSMALWAAFATSAAACLISARGLPWNDTARLRPHVLPLAASFLCAVSYFSMAAMGWHGKPKCRRFHPVYAYQAPGGDGSGNGTITVAEWKLGAVPDLLLMEVCRVLPGLYGFSFSYTGFLWVAQLGVLAGGTLSTACSSLGLMAIFLNHRKWDDNSFASQQANIIMALWPFAWVSFFVARASYSMATHSNRYARKLFFSLLAYLATLYAAQGLVTLWEYTTVLPSDREHIAFAVLNILMSPVLTLALLTRDVPNLRAGEDEDETEGRGPLPRAAAFDPGWIAWAILCARFSFWYYQQQEQS